MRLFTFLPAIQRSPQKIQTIGAIVIICLSYAVGFGQSSSWKPVEGHIMTRWAKDVQPDNAHKDYPRPIMKRKDWKSLNGLWEYAITDGSKTPDNYDGQILVPFPVESALSGVKKMIDPEERLWYTRDFEIPDDWGDKRVLLHFEAVDWHTEVWLNDRRVGNHRGGYDPFSFDVTNYLTSGKQTLRVKVEDPTDSGWQPLGKQVNEPEGIFYTPTTGIWQTVWLEAVPRSYITDFKATPDIDQSLLTLHVFTNTEEQNRVRATVAYRDQTVTTVEGEISDVIRIPIDNPKLWSPDSPDLYDLKIELIRNDQVIDNVESYFGMRKIAIGKDKDGFVRLWLNNEVVFQNGPLDQGYWPDGIYTPPTDDALKFDIEMAKRLGFNMLRKHVKVESRRFYHWCDRLGILVWQDMPNGDKKIGPKDPDIERSAASARQFEYELEKLIATHYNHPSIVMWIPFNEGWGQYDSQRITDWVRKLDPTRLVNHASGWTDRGIGDIKDDHTYPGPQMPGPEEERAIVLGEFGGLGLKIDQHGWQEENWGYTNLGSSDELQAQYEEYYTRIWDFEKENGLSASVYTQITDVETEANGLLTYDREVVKVAIDETYRVNTNTYIPAPDLSLNSGLYRADEPVKIFSPHGGIIRYTLDGSIPDANDTPYTKPLYLTGDLVLSARVFKDTGSSRVSNVELEETKIERPKYTEPPHTDYTLGGDFALLDGIYGTDRFRDGRWQGFRKKDMGVDLNLGEKKELNTVTVRFLEDTQSWIFLPQSVTLYASANGEKYKEVETRQISQPSEHQEVNVRTISFEMPKKKIKYLKIEAVNVGKCPEWHGGGEAWIFTDEIKLE